MTGTRPCEVPTGGHDGTARLYPCGWRCTTHAPQPRTTPADTTAPVAPAPARRRTRADAAPRQVTAALFIDLGAGRANNDLGPGHFIWMRPPQARYECVACGWESETVTGAESVTGFVGHIRTTHRATCPAALTTEGAHAA